MNIQFVHLNIVAKDWKKLSKFYIDVFNCKPKLPERHLKGEWLDKATNIKNAKIDGIHLVLPGSYDNPPTLEIFEYNENNSDFIKSDTESIKSINRPGFAHIAFLVDDVNKACQLLEKNGGSKLGEIITQKIAGVGIITFIYAKDPEKNIIELQHWEYFNK